jgi:hypothetical protein
MQASSIDKRQGQDMDSARISYRDGAAIGRFSVVTHHESVDNKQGVTAVRHVVILLKIAGVIYKSEGPFHFA